MLSDCDHTDTTPGYVYYINGAQHVHLKCDRCNKIAEHATSKALYDNVKLPTWEDNTNYTLYPECAYNGCNSPGLHEHHWAMQSIFDDSNRWPTSHLCQPHHSQWHSAMLNNGLRYPQKEATA